MTDRLPLTVIIPAFNEEENLPACLASVSSLAAEILVVDSFSTDRTGAIAREHGARVLQHEYVNSAAQKNWAIPQALHEWVLLVDADERVTPALAEEIAGLFRDGRPRHPGYWIRRRNHFLGREMKHGGWETDAVIRLFARDKARYSDREVHAEIDLPGPLPMLENRLLHYSIRSWRQYWPKIEKYTDWGASQALRDGKRAGTVSILFRPLLRFVKMYVLRLGFLDGVEGAQLALLGAFSVYLKYSKLWELSRSEAGGHAPRDARRDGRSAGSGMEARGQGGRRDAASAGEGLEAGDRGGQREGLSGIGADAQAARRDGPSAGSGTDTEAQAGAEAEGQEGLSPRMRGAGRGALHPGRERKGG